MIDHTNIGSYYKSIYFCFICKISYTYFLVYWSFMHHVLRFFKFLDQHEYTLLIGSLFLLLVFYPFTIGWASSELWIHVCVSLVLITGVYAASTFKKFLSMSLIVGTMSFVFLWLEFLISNRIVLFFYLITGLFLFIFITLNLVRNLTKEDEVTPELILWAIAWYLMIGLLSAFIFALIHFFEPGAISTITDGGLTAFPELIYFSYVNMTTVWYGDILPVSAHAQARSILSTIAWQMYLTILIWVIVGKYIRRGKPKHND